MKKKVLAFVCAAVMAMGVSLTAFAAPSPDAENVSGSTFSVGDKQNFTENTFKSFADTTKVAGGTVTAVSASTAQEAIAEAVKLEGDDAFVASIVDIYVPNATFPYALTIECPNVWAGQSVTVLHKVGDTWERLTPSKVADNSLTVSVNSFSPFAIVIDTNPSPKTGDISLMVSGLAGLFGAGSVFTRRKIRK